MKLFIVSGILRDPSGKRVFTHDLIRRADEEAALGYVAKQAFINNFVLERAIATETAVPDDPMDIAEEPKAA